MTKIVWIAIGVIVLSLWGCQPREERPVTRVPDLTSELIAKFEEEKPPPPEAGVKTDPKVFDKEGIIKAANLRFIPRKNPFAMFGEEIAFQTAIQYRIIMSKMPGYSNLLPPPVEEPAPELIPPEQQPYRRVVGVAFSDSVSALVEMEDGRTYVVRPGSRVGDSEWFVETITETAIILQRDPRKNPSRVIIRLETRPIGMSGGSAGGSGTGGSGGTGTAPPVDEGGGRPGRPGID